MKTKKYWSLALALLLALFLTACGEKASQEKTDPAQTSQEETQDQAQEGAKDGEQAETGDLRRLVDGKGREVEVPAKVERVVCVGVGALRYSSYVGAAERMVGVEEHETKQSLARLYNYVNYEHFKDLPITGTNGAPLAEEIIKVQPDVIVMSFSSKEDADALSQKTGRPVFVVPGSDTTLDANSYETIRLLGELYGLEERAQEVTDYLKGIEEDLDRRTASIPEEDKPSTYVGGVSFQGNHGFDGTEANYGPFRLIHAKNLADTTDQKGAFTVDKEKILEWDPEVIFLDYNGLDLVQEDLAANPSYYASLQAIQKGKVYSQVSFRSFASNLETALVDAYYCGSILYPEAFQDITLSDKAGEIFTELLGQNPYQDLQEAGYVFQEIKLGE